MLSICNKTGRESLTLTPELIFFAVPVDLVLALSIYLYARYLSLFNSNYQIAQSAEAYTDDQANAHYFLRSRQPVECSAPE